jgi:NADPH:quinone reductase-like Zn-dependent oxidoreductase
VRRRPERCQTVDRIGAFAEFIAVTEDDVATKPGELTMEEAASSPLTGVTGWQVMNEKANLPAGQKVPSHAGSGGVGTCANQPAKHLCAPVATTTSTTHAEWAKRLGAETVIDYKKDDFAEILHDNDLVLVTLGGETLGFFG